jgi:2-hydroxychromene-2-carboxylate isomerase
MKLWIKRQIMARATDLDRRDLARVRARARREKTGAPRVLHYFHRFGDPASALMAPLMIRLAQRFDVTVCTRLTGLPEKAVAPEPEQLEAVARADTARLAKLFGLGFADPGASPAQARIIEAEALAAAAVLGDEDALPQITALDAALWSGAALPAGSGPGGSGDRDRALKAGTRARDALGHFQSGAVEFEGEWYWGADRLHYLETRLDDDGARIAGEGFLAPPLLESQARGDAGGAVIEVYPSLRSPYTYLAMERVYALARRWNARVELYPVLPMVMRKLPVPQRKAMYFLKDCAREAERLALSFGTISDPVGAPTERGLAVLLRAMESGQGEAFITAFLEAAWSEAINAGSDGGLKEICARAGVPWADAQAALKGDSWRPCVEANRNRLTGLGLWGVPSFRVGDLSVWGQDRLFLVEAELQGIAGARS